MPQNKQFPIHAKVLEINLRKCSVATTNHNSSDYAQTTKDTRSYLNFTMGFFVLRLNIPVNNFSVMSGRSQLFLGKIFFFAFLKTDTDQLSLCSNCTADQCLCFHYLDDTISLLVKSEISSFLPSSLAVQGSLYQIRSQGYKTFFMLSSAETKIYPAHKCLNANNCWHFNIYEQTKLLDFEF